MCFCIPNKNWQIYSFRRLAHLADVTCKLANTASFNSQPIIVTLDNRGTSGFCISLRGLSVFGMNDKANSFGRIKSWLPVFRKRLFLSPPAFSLSTMTLACTDDQDHVLLSYKMPNCTWTYRSDPADPQNNSHCTTARRIGSCHLHASLVLCFIRHIDIADG